MPNQDQFAYERLLKTLADALTPEQFEQFKNWKFLQTACETYISEISIHGIDNKEIQSNDVKAFFGMENGIKNIISEVFLALPNPTELGQRWDEGAAKKNAQMHEQAIVELAEFISNEYQMLREALSNVMRIHQEYAPLKEIIHTNKTTLNIQEDIGSPIKTQGQSSLSSRLDDDFF